MSDMELITVADLAERWGRSKFTIYHLIRRKRDPLPAYQFGRSWTLRFAEAEEWLARQSNLKNGEAA